MTDSEYLLGFLPGRAGRESVQQHLVQTPPPPCAAHPAAADRSATAHRRRQRDGQKRLLTRFVDSIGYRTVDAGLLADGWAPNSLRTPVYVTPYGFARRRVRHTRRARRLIPCGASTPQTRFAVPFAEFELGSLLSSTRTDDVVVEGQCSGPSRRRRLRRWNSLH